MRTDPSLTTGPIGRRLVALTLPMMMGIMSLMVFNLVDTFFLGRYSIEALSAIAFTFPVVMFVGNLALGLGVGVSAVVSKAIGMGDPERARRLTTDSLSLSVLIVLIFAVAGYATIDPLFAALGAEGRILELTRQYMQVYYASVGMVVIPMIGNSATRATGDTKTPSLVMLIAALTNVVLDPLMIFGWGPVPELGMRGAALATAISRAISLVAALYLLGRRDRMLSRRGMTPAEVLRNWRRTLHVGLPAAATRMIVPLGVGVITHLVARHGSEAVAAFGIGSRVGMFVFAVVMALAAALAPFIGQNLGARRPDRVRRAAWLSTGFGFLYGLAVSVLVALLAEPITRVFNDHPAVVAVSVDYFRIVPLGAAFSAVLAIAGTVLNAMFKPMTAASLAFLQMFVLNIPLSYLAAATAGLRGIFWAAVAANVVAGALSALVMRRHLRDVGA